jgi:hypothetical protein
MKKIYNLIFGFSLMATFLVIGAHESQAAIFGNSNSGAATQAMNTKAFCASSTPVTSGTVTSISVLASSTPATKVGVAIYSVNPTTLNPGTLLASNKPSSVAPPVTKAWVTVPISYTIAAGTPYYLCAWANGNFNTYYDSVAGYGKIVDQSSAASWENWTNPIGSVTYMNNHQMSIYATYDPASTGYVSMQSASTYVSASTSQSVKLPNPVKAGNLIVVYFQQAGNYQPTVTDSLGNTYTLAISRNSGGSNIVGGWIYYTISAADGVDWVRATKTGGSDWGFHVAEVSGISQTNPLITVTAGAGSGTNAVASTTLDVTENAFIYSGGGNEKTAGLNIPGAGYTKVTEQSGQNSFTQYKMASAGSYAVTGTVPNPGTAQWTILGAAFRTSGCQPAGTFEAGSLSGWAWSGNIGWISLNSNNYCAGGGPYSVKLSTSTSATLGTLSGYAWSPNIGWIKFGGLTNTPDGTPGTATIDLTSGQVSGWARACAGTASGDCSSMTSRTDGWDGWIRLSDEKHLSPDFSGNGGVTMKTTGDINGYAWGSTVVGWINFLAKCNQCVSSPLTASLLLQVSDTKSPSNFVSSLEVTADEFNIARLNAFWLLTNKPASAVVQTSSDDWPGGAGKMTVSSVTLQQSSEAPVILEYPGVTSPQTKYLRLYWKDGANPQVDSNVVKVTLLEHPATPTCSQPPHTTQLCPGGNSGTRAWTVKACSETPQACEFVCAPGFKPNKDKNLCVKSSIGEF